MRFSTDDADPGYANWRAFRPLRVLLDGKELKRAQMADSDIGEAIVNSENEHGCAYLNEAKTEVVTETVRGAITFELIHPSNPFN